MSGDNNPFSAADPFTTFWTDFMKRAASSGMTPPTPSPDFTNQMRRSFFDAMARNADELMRSESFLTAMKQSMENALAWQQSMNQFLQKGLAAGQMPSKADSEHVVLLVRGMEDRVLGKLEELSRRVERLEQGGEARPKAAKTN